MSFLPLSTAVGLTCPPQPLLPDFGVSVPSATDQTVAAVRGERGPLTSPMTYKLLELTGLATVLGVDRPSRPEVVPAKPQVPAPVEVPGAGGAYEGLVLEPASEPDA